MAHLSFVFQPASQHEWLKYVPPSYSAMQHRMRMDSDVVLNMEVSISAPREILFPAGLKLLAVPPLYNRGSAACQIDHPREYFNPLQLPNLLEL